MSRKMFPILGDGIQIPWDLIERYEPQAVKNHGQNYQELARRGGLDSEEMLAVIHGLGWKEAQKRWPDPRKALLQWVDENDLQGPGTPTARWEYFLEELEKRFPDPEPSRSDRTAEQHYLQTIDTLLESVLTLGMAIKTHRAQKADDRCIEDDDRLYAALGDGIKCDRRVGSKGEMLKNCARFIEKRCEEGQWPTYAELEAKIAKLRATASKCIEHAICEKPEITAPPRNRLQNIVCLLEEALR